MKTPGSKGVCLPEFTVLSIFKSDCILRLNAAGDFSNRWRWKRMAVSSWTFYITKNHIYQQLILFPFHWLNLGTSFFKIFLFFVAMVVFSFFKIYICCRVSCLHCLGCSRLGFSIGVVLDGEKILAWHFSVC